MWPFLLPRGIKGLISQNSQKDTCKFCESSKNTFFTEHLWTTASIDYRVKKSCAIISTQVTFETDHNSLLSDSTMSSAPNLCSACILLGNLKEKDHIKRNINSKKKEMFICEISIIIITLICQKLESVGPVQQKIKLPSPY